MWRLVSESFVTITIHYDGLVDFQGQSRNTILVGERFTIFTWSRNVFQRVLPAGRYPHAKHLLIYFWCEGTGGAHKLIDDRVLGILISDRRRFFIVLDVFFVAFDGNQFIKKRRFGVAEKLLYDRALLLSLSVYLVQYRTTVYQPEFGCDSYSPVLNLQFRQPRANGLDLGRFGESLAFFCTALSPYLKSFCEFALH